LVFHGLGEGCNSRTVTQVDGHTNHSRIPARDLIQQWLSATSDDDLVALSVQRLGKDTPDAAGASGDEDSVT
jgi:hypothetical protein